MPRKFFVRQMLSLLEKRRARRRKGLGFLVSILSRGVESLPGPRWTQKPVKTLHPSRFNDLFRFSREQFEQVLNAYQFPQYMTVSKVKTCRWDILGVVLRRLAVPGPWSCHCDLFGRSVTALKLMFRAGLRHMFEKCRDRIQKPSRSFLTRERLLRYCDAITRKGGRYNRVFGFLDGTIYQLCRPGGETLWQRSIYNGHKRHHGLKWQGVNTPDGLVQFLHGPFASRHHDTWCLAQSKLTETLTRSFALAEADRVPGSPETHFMLFGDPGLLRVTACDVVVAVHSSQYTLLSFTGYSNVKSAVIQAPFVSLRGHTFLPEDKRAFNRQMAKLRVSVEWMFKDITGAWSYLKFAPGLKVKQQPVGIYYIVAADLTNMRTILRGGGQTAMYFNCAPPTLEEYVAPRVYDDDDGPNDHVPLVNVEAAVNEVVADFDADPRAQQHPDVVYHPADVVAGLAASLDRFAVGDSPRDDELIDTFGYVRPAMLDGVDGMAEESNFDQYVVHYPDGTSERLSRMTQREIDAAQPKLCGPTVTV